MAKRPGLVGRNRSRPVALGKRRAESVPPLPSPGNVGARSPKTADALILRTSGGESLFARGAFELKSWLFVVRFSTIWLPSCRIESRDLNSEVLEESGLVVQRGA